MTATIQKENREETAQLCYVVRDEDPWYKLFWSVDDVLDANFVFFNGGVESRTLEGNFVLENRDGEVCGFGAIPGSSRVRGCSGESEAEVYIQPVTEDDGPTGPQSAIHKIRLQ